MHTLFIVITWHALYKKNGQVSYSFFIREHKVLHLINISKKKNHYDSEQFCWNDVIYCLPFSPAIISIYFINYPWAKDITFYIKNYYHFIQSNVRTLCTHNSATTHEASWYNFILMCYLRYHTHHLSNIRDVIRYNRIGWLGFRRKILKFRHI